MYSQVSQDTPRRRSSKEEGMSPGSGRKKPICQTCGSPMAGHKRPQGIPVCPYDAPELSHKRSPSPASVYPAGPSAPRKDFDVDFTFNPTASGYWHRSNPNWNPGFNSITQNPLDTVGSVPKRGDIAGSWVSTERDDASRSSLTHRRRIPSPIVRSHLAEAIDVDAEEDEEECSDIQSTVSPRSSDTILHRVGRSLSLVLGRSTPIASLYSSPRDQVTAITSAAEAEGLYTRVMHLGRDGVKPEPVTPPRTIYTREHSWRVAVGRDRSAVNALADSHTPPRTEDTVEPYDYDRGLSHELNECVGTYPVDPRWIRNTYFDIMAAGAVGGIVVFICLSAI